ncbi:MAG: hypothetical protein WCJ39_07470 [bacterium]
MTIEEIRQDIQSKKAVLNERIHDNTILDTDILVAKKQIASLEKLEAHFNS